MKRLLVRGATVLFAVAVAGALAAGCGTPTPTITMISPTSGPGGSDAAITGSGFGRSQGTDKVLFSRTEAKVLSWTDTAIAVKVPSDLQPGSYMVKVAVGSTTSNQVAFVVKATAPEDASRRGEIEHNTPVKAMLSYLQARGEPTSGYSFQVNAVSGSDPDWKIDVSFYTGNPQPAYWLLHRVNGSWQVLAYGTDWNPQQLGAPGDLRIVPVEPPAPVPPAKPDTQAEAVQAYLASKGRPTDGWVLTVGKTSSQDGNWEVIHGVRDGSGDNFLVVWNNMLGNWQVLADGGPPWTGVQFKGKDVPSDLNR